MGRFEAMVVLITGGSSGIGYATARAFLEEGARVGIVGRGKARMRRAVSSLSRVGRVLGLRGDVSKARDVKRFVSETRRTLGPIDVLVNNAGVYLSKPVEGISEAEYDEVMDINMKGAFLCTKYVLPSMVRRRRGVIVNVASDSGLVGSAGASVYAASKGALVLFTKAVALDHAEEGIRVNAVCPGEVKTPMLEKDAAESGRGFDEYYRRLVEPIPMKRAATAEEIARAILFLAGEDSSFMTGAALSVDGGSTAM